MSKVTNIEDGKHEYDGDWSIICMNAYDFAVELTIGPFGDSEEAVEFALADKRCRDDWQWTVIPNEFPHTETGIVPGPTDNALDPRNKGTEESVPFENNPEKED